MICGIFFCAGISSRMKDQKLLLPFGGSTVVENSFMNLLFSDIDYIVVVSGRTDSVEERLKGIAYSLRKQYPDLSRVPVKFIRNPEPEKGQASSMKLGLAAAPEESSAFLFALGDMPLIETKEMNNLLAFSRKNSNSIVFPSRGGDRGNPSIFPVILKDELLRQTGDKGGRSVLKKHKDLHLPFKTELNIWFRDIDTGEDYETVNNKNRTESTRNLVEILKSRLNPVKRYKGLKPRDDAESDNSKSCVITVSGGGGKTSFLLFLAKALSGDFNTALTTTTKLLSPSVFEYGIPSVDYKRIDIKQNILKLPNPVLITGASSHGGKKISGPPEENLRALRDSGVYNFIIIESDGSDGRPVKVHGETEPVIPSYTDICVSVIGMSALGRKKNGDTIHRIEKFSLLFGEDGNSVDTRMLIDLSNHPKGLFKDTPEESIKILLCNQWDLVEEKERGRVIAELRTGLSLADYLVLSELGDNNFIHSVYKLS